MQSHSILLAFLAFSFGAISVPVPSLESRFTSQLVFHGARYEDSFGISTPGDGFVVTINEFLFYDSSMRMLHAEKPLRGPDLRWSCRSDKINLW